MMRFLRVYCIIIVVIVAVVMCLLSPVASATTSSLAPTTATSLASATATFPSEIIATFPSKILAVDSYVSLDSNSNFFRKVQFKSSLQSLPGKTQQQLLYDWSNNYSNSNNTDNSNSNTRHYSKVDLGNTNYRHSTNVESHPDRNYLGGNIDNIDNYTNTSNIDSTSTAAHNTTFANNSRTTNLATANFAAPKISVSAASSCIGLANNITNCDQSYNTSDRSICSSVTIMANNLAKVNFDPLGADSNMRLNLFYNNISAIQPYKETYLCSNNKTHISDVRDRAAMTTTDTTSATIILATNYSMAQQQYNNVTEEQYYINRDENSTETATVLKRPNSAPVRSWGPVNDIIKRKTWGRPVSSEDSFSEEKNNNNNIYPAIYNPAREDHLSSNLSKDIKKGDRLLAKVLAKVNKMTNKSDYNYYFREFEVIEQMNNTGVENDGVYLCAEVDYSNNNESNYNIEPNKSSNSIEPNKSSNSIEPNKSSNKSLRGPLFVLKLVTWRKEAKHAKLEGETLQLFHEASEALCDADRRISTRSSNNFSTNSSLKSGSNIRSDNKSGSSISEANSGSKTRDFDAVTKYNEESGEITVVEKHATESEKHIRAAEDEDFSSDNNIHHEEFLNFLSNSSSGGGTSNNSSSKTTSNDSSTSDNSGISKSSKSFHSKSYHSNSSSKGDGSNISTSICRDAGLESAHVFAPRLVSNEIYVVRDGLSSSGYYSSNRYHRPVSAERQGQNFKSREENTTTTTTTNYRFRDTSDKNSSSFVLLERAILMEQAVGVSLAELLSSGLSYHGKNNSNFESGESTSITNTNYITRQNLEESVRKHLFDHSGEGISHVISAVGSPSSGGLGSSSGGYMGENEQISLSRKKQQPLVNHLEVVNREVEREVEILESRLCDMFSFFDAIGFVNHRHYKRYDSHYSRRRSAEKRTQDGVASSRNRKKDHFYNDPDGKSAARNNNIIRVGNGTNYASTKFFEENYHSSSYNSYLTEDLSYYNYDNHYHIVNDNNYYHIVNENSYYMANDDEEEEDQIVEQLSEGDFGSRKFSVSVVDSDADWRLDHIFWDFRTKKLTKVDFGMVGNRWWGFGSSSTSSSSSSAIGDDDDGENLNSSRNNSYDDSDISSYSNSTYDNSSSYDSSNYFYDNAYVPHETLDQYSHPAELEADGYMNLLNDFLPLEIDIRDFTRRMGATTLFEKFTSYNRDKFNNNRDRKKARVLKNYGNANRNSGSHNNGDYNNSDYSNSIDYHKIFKKKRRRTAWSLYDHFVNADWRIECV